jgi:SAM-dependent methyltransferase
MTLRLLMTSSSDKGIRTIMTADYDHTPSFYKNEETFRKYLGQTSYYRALQTAVLQLSDYIKPSSIAELGSGTGATACALAAAHPQSRVISVDFRSEMIELCRREAEKSALANISLYTSDMANFFSDHPSPDLTVMLYSFHHLIDPEENKVNFLRHAHEAMNPGQYLCIGETFLPEHYARVGELAAVDRLWSVRPLEGYASTFWAALEGVSQEAISLASEVGRFSFENEYKAGEMVRHRNGEYLITLSWLVTNASDAGFQVLIAEPVNSVGDGVVLMKKQ